MSKKNLFCSISSRIRFAKCIVFSKINISFVVINIRTPFAVFLLSNASRARCVISCYLPIFVILFHGCFSKIAHSIIGRIPVYVIYLVMRPISILKKPCETMSFIHFFVYIQNYISIRVFRSNFMAIPSNMIFRICFPRKNSRVSIIFNCILKSFNGQHFISYLISELRFILTHSNLHFNVGSNLKTRRTLS